MPNVSDPSRLPPSFELWKQQMGGGYSPASNLTSGVINAANVTYGTTGKSASYTASQILKQ